MSVSKHTAYNLAGAIIPLVLSFATVPLTLHLVGADRFGVLAIAWLLLGYFGLFDLGLGKATSYRMASLNQAEPAVRADVFRTALLINAGIGVVGGLVLWLAGWWFFGSIFKVGPELRAETLSGLPWLAASVPVATMTGVLTGALQGREKFLETNIVSVISTVLFQLLPIAVAWQFGPHLAGLLAAAVAARVAAILVLWYDCHKEFTRGQTARWQRSEAGALLRFGGWVTLNGILWPLFIMTDRFAIGAVLGAAAVAIYTIPFQLAQRSGIVPNAVANAMFPRMASVGDEQRKMLLKKAIQSMAALLTLPVFLAIFLFLPFLKLWIGAEMAQKSHAIGVIIMLGFWANAFVALFFAYYQAGGRPKLVTQILAWQILPYLGLLWLALMTWGLMGAAIVFLARAAINLAPMLISARPGKDTHVSIALDVAVLTAGWLLRDPVFDGSAWAIATAIGLSAYLTWKTSRSVQSLFPDAVTRAMRLLRG